MEGEERGDTTDDADSLVVVGVGGPLIATELGVAEHGMVGGVMDG